MKKKVRKKGGFAVLDKEFVIEMAGKGGKTAWAKGKAHKWDSVSAKAAVQIREAKRKLKK